MKRTKWTDEVIQFMNENYQGKDNIQLAELLNKRFSLNTNADRVSNIKANLLRRKGIDLRTGINNGGYKKGHIPANKGTKGLTKANRTSFKKGNIPPNYREIGSERITQDGYIMIKVRDGCLNKNWELKHRWLYEKEFGKIPEGYNLIFLDGNKQNVVLSNLKLVSKSEDLIMNRNKLFSTDKDITNTGSLIAKVIDKTNKVQQIKEGN